MPHLFDLPSAIERFPEIEERLAGGRPAVFLDYDGTLTPIVARPELAVLVEPMRDLVADLSRVCTVAVVSGRDRGDVERLVGIDSIVYAGSHGFDIAGPEGFTAEYEHATHLLPAIEEFGAVAQDRLADVEGSLVERKKYSVAVHWRLVDDADVPTVEAVVDEVVASMPELRKTSGKRVFDIQPKIDWHKGKAVRWIMRALDLEGDDVVPLFLGDDLTDEDAFAELKGQGIGVIVVAGSDRETEADYSLEDPDEVGRFLRQLTDSLS